MFLMNLRFYVLAYLTVISFQICNSSLVVEEIDELHETHGVTVEEKEMFLNIVAEEVYELQNEKLVKMLDIFTKWLLNENFNKPPNNLEVHKPLFKPPPPPPHPSSPHNPPYPPPHPSTPFHHQQTSCPKPQISCAQLGEMCTNDFRNTGEESNDLEYTSNELRNLKCCDDDICYNNRCCTDTPATAKHSICREDSHCCGSDRGIAVCDTTVGLCKVPLGEMCSLSSDCFIGQCDGGVCCYPSYGLPNARLITTSDHPCLSDDECCETGVCGTDGVCRIPPGGSCSCGIQCASGVCTDGIC